MAKFSPTVQDLENLDKRITEIKKRVYKGSLDPKGAYDALQPIIEGKFPLVSDPFGNYTGMLLSLDQQFALLREYNEKYWGGKITEEQFAAVNTDSDHTQRVEDLEILYVEFGSPKETFENWIAVIKGENPRFWRGGSLNDGYDIRLFNRNVQKYSPGIHRIHINLVVDWNPENGNSVDASRSRVKGTKENLAHGEVFAAYALHTELLQATDGTNLPYFDAPGYEVKPSGVSEWRVAPYGDWSAGGGRAGVNSSRADDRGQDFAAPVVWES